MTETLLQKLEEQMMLLLTEYEDLRKENNRITQENLMLKTKQDQYSGKLTDLISLLDTTINASDAMMMGNVAMPAMKPVLVQA